MNTIEQPLESQHVEDRLIRDLVAEYPDVMTVLEPFGMDLCCGGGHPLGEALDLHGVPREPVVSEISKMVSRPSVRS